MLLYNIYIVGKYWIKARIENDRTTIMEVDNILMPKWNLRLNQQLPKWYRTVIDSNIWNILAVYDDGHKEKW